VVHGKAHETEILKECQSNQEIKHWGKYYSDLWDIVNAVDNLGNKIWANLKPEEGDGGFVDLHGNNPMKDPEIKKKISGENHYSKKSGYIWKLSGINNNSKKPEAVEKLSGDNNYQRKLGYIPKKKGITHQNYNHTKYVWENITTGELIQLTKQEFRIKFNTTHGNVCNVANGKRKTVCGWKIHSTK